MTDSPDTLDRYLDRLARHEAADAPDLSPELLAIDHQFREIGDVPGPERIFTDRLEESLLATVTAAPPQPTFAPETSQSSEPPAPARRAPTRLPPWGAGRWASLLLVAAMAIAALGFATNPLRPLRDWLDGRNEPGGFAVQAPGTPVPAIEEIVLTLTLPDVTVPRGEGVSAGLAHFSIPPGARSRWLPTCCPGPMVEFVVAGSYAVTAEGPITVLRADGSEESIAANTEVVLVSGDALFSRNETVVEAANTGDVPVELLNWVLIAAGDFGGHSLPGWASLAADVQGDLILPPGSADVVLRRIEMPPNTVVPAPPTGTFTFAVTLPRNALGTPVLGAGRNEDGEVRSHGRHSLTVYILTLMPTGAAGGTPVAGFGSGTPVAGTPTP